MSKRARIPWGDYCYEYNPRDPGRHNHTCPYWSRDPQRLEQESGYCSLLRAGDWMPAPRGTWLLWDQVKECQRRMSWDPPTHVQKALARGAAHRRTRG